MAISYWTPQVAQPANQAENLFKIGNFEFHTYSLTLMMGILASILTISIFWYREKYKWENLFALVLLTIPFALIGARLWDLVEEYIYKRDTFDFSQWYAIWKGGLSIQGGVVLAFAVDFMYVYAKRDVMDIRKAVSIIIPAILIGQVIGRWGNFANHELYGKVDWSGQSDLMWGKRFASQMFISDDISKNYGVIGLYRYPLFLYEGLLNLFGYLVLVWIINEFGLLKPGSTGTLYFVWYGVVRLSMEPLRQTAYAMYTITSAVFIALGTIGFIFFEFFDPVHYVRKWQKYRFVYQYAHPEKYIKWIESTRFFRTKRTKEPIKKLIQ